MMFEFLGEQKAFLLTRVQQPGKPAAK
jgi:hypothetical protein